MTKLQASYSQLSVFNAGMNNPFNGWRPIHVAQGFSWRPGSASFSLLAANGDVEIIVSSGEKFLPEPWAKRIIQIPYFVEPFKPVEIATISDSFFQKVEQGNKLLTFQHGIVEGLMMVSLSFSPVCTIVEARLILTDDALSPPAILFMEASPA